MPPAAGRVIASAKNRMWGDSGSGGRSSSGTESKLYGEGGGAVAWPFAGPREGRGRLLGVRKRMCATSFTGKAGVDPHQLLGGLALFQFRAARGLERLEELLGGKELPAGAVLEGVGAQVLDEPAQVAAARV